MCARLPPRLARRACRRESAWPIARRRHRGGDFLGKRVVTDDGLVDLAPDELGRTRRARSSSPRFESERSATRNKLKLISKREQHSHNSWLHNHPRFVAGETVDELSLHASRRCHGKTGVAVWRRGRGPKRSVAVGPGCRCELTDEMMVGAVALPHGWGHQEADGLSVASQDDRRKREPPRRRRPRSQLEYFSGMAKLNGIWVEVVPV